MKSLKYIITLLFVTALFTACNDDEFDSGFLDNAPAPTNLSALFTITQDNTGLVTIQPNGEGVANYSIYFGDGTPDPATVTPGQKAQHNYAEGVYDVKIVGNGITGKQTEIIEQLTVTFVAPENLSVNIATVNGDPFTINVSATADYETFYEVTFGEDESAAPVQFNEGDQVSYTYSDIGTYDVTVTAFSGGAATTTVTQQVTITNPLLLPVDFENSTLNYAFGDFGNATTSVVANPDQSGINTSTMVGQQVKNAGAEVWAGTSLALDAPIDFASLNQVKLKVWSPAAGVTVKFKVENLADSNINYEVDQVTTTANQWEELTYDFSAIDTNNEYGRIVLFFNFGVNGSGETYYFDDIKLAAPAQAVVIPLNFEYDIEYTFNGFGNAFGAKVANPDQSGINTSGFVGQVVKNNGAETWAGVHMPLVAPIDFSTQQKIKMKVWSPQAGITVLLKLENNGATITTELPATTTVANQWEELVYDFTGIDNSANFQNVVLFFDFNQPGTGATYYFDDIELTN
ncbi:hypothetical protein FUA48_10115 [Flavobacterium alkalisoli]|uniref:PKD domain-containing protein n=1 Tax=Flavobacterium alkalisoli TaxID=2602769 RepID=A0A5B9FUN2_9FLAO|nr:hypothetical protein [Flavobacterium alkalisoli]QEE49921.1 hypothetical protein FUA48_10115 [Flavobacterium alkalisoli]